MPPSLASRFTVSELATMRVIADEVRDHGACTRSIAELAARSGTSRSVVKRALKAAVECNMLHVEVRPVPGRKNLTNRITITSTEWRTWMARAGKFHMGKKTGVQNRTPTAKSLLNKRDWECDDATKRGAELSSGGAKGWQLTVLSQVQSYSRL